MKVRRLAESVILQSLEDLWDDRYRAESIDFFTGREFHLFARMANMDTEDKIKLLRMVKKANTQVRKERRLKSLSAPSSLSVPRRSSLPMAP
jgi:hypothetical protein